ncbi:MAG: hypothetical protein ACO3CQ_00840 [Candidatus Nanopelagicaceae bacterium]
MSKGQLLSNDTSGIELMYMWFGQIVDDSTWRGNSAKEDGAHTLRTRDDFQGYGYRYKVRIFGRDIPDKDDPKKGVTDDQLVMAEVAMPVTAGSGQAGSTQTPNLRQGNYVFGFYKDGVDATEPIIFGVLPNHAQTRLFGGDPDKGFVPRTGYVGQAEQKPVSNKNILGEGPDGGNPISESTGSNYVLDVRDIDVRDEQRKHYVPKTYDCDTKAGGSFSAISKILNDVMKFVNKIKSAANSFFGAISDTINGLQSIIEDAALLIADLMKGVIDKIRGFALNLLNKSLSKAHSLLPPNKTSGTNEIFRVIIDIILCVFNKLIKGLFNSILKLLTNLVNSAASIAQCAVENFIGSLLAGILGPITSALNSISGIIDGISGILSGMFSALESLLGILDLINCDENLDCSSGDGWSFWYGADFPTPSPPNFSGAIRGLAEFPDIGEAVASCFDGPLASGPPKVKFNGGGGTGAIGNAIIGPNGQVLGVDILDGGNGYTTSPTVTLESDGGDGSGAVLYAVLQDDNTFLGGQGGSTSRNPQSDDLLSKLNTLGRAKTPTNVKINSNGPLLVTDSGQQIYVGGTGGTTLTTFNTNVSSNSPGVVVPKGNRFTYKKEPVTVNFLSEITDSGDGKEVNTNFGLLKIGSVGGTPARVGGTDGNEVFYIDPDSNSYIGIRVNVEEPLFANIDQPIIAGPYKGTFEGVGTYSNGSFAGTGLFKAKDAEGKDIRLSGRFSGFDSSLSGYGSGTFTGIGTIENGRFVGDGIFISDVSKIINLTGKTVDDGNGNITSPDGTKITINPDGTGLVTYSDGTQRSVAVLKSNSTGGSEVTSGNSKVFVTVPTSTSETGATGAGTGAGTGTTGTDGEGTTTQQVFSGGYGGTLIKLSTETGSNIIPVTTEDGLPVTINGIPVVVGSNTGIPLVIGADSDKPPATVNGIQLTSNGNVVKSPIKVGGVSEGVVSKGSFAGPDGSPVQQVVVIDSGVGYLQAPDGTTGGAGTKLSQPDGTIIFSENSGYSAYPPNSIIPVLEGDLAYLPPQTIAEVYNSEGDLLQTLTGQGQTNPVVIESTGLITTPTYDANQNKPEAINSPVSDGSYLTLLTINDVLIANSGINYSPDDKITITPDNGTILTPRYDKFGRLSSVVIENPGIGFTKFPNIRIKSVTGINAYIIPIFGVVRRGTDVAEFSDVIQPNTTLIEVVDCVGKISKN